MPDTERTSARTERPWSIAAWTACLGMVLVVVGVFLMMSSTRTNLADDFAWYALMLGTSLTAAGITMPFARRWVVVVVAVLAPFTTYLLLVILFWAALLFNRWPDQRPMVHSGYTQISQAAEIDVLMGPARHGLANFKEPNVAEWISKAYFAGRYELTMHLHVEIDRRTGEVTNLLEEPKFMLGEITAVQGRGVSYGQWHEFGPAEWEKVVRAGGDFSVIGITLDLDHPLPGFDKYEEFTRRGIEMTAPQP